ncbi:MAG: hypothetical protein JHC98_09755 [Thermoleophilaceae bacterium]|nr:hypothetical protein [Thermoleophilaceae bacterium]
MKTPECLPRKSSRLLVGLLTLLALACAPASASAMTLIEVDSYKGPSPLGAEAGKSGSLVFFATGSAGTLTMQTNPGQTAYTVQASSGVFVAGLSSSGGAQLDDTELECTGFTTSTLTCPITETPGSGESAEGPLNLWLTDDNSAINWTLTFQVPASLPYPSWPAPLVEVRPALGNSDFLNRTGTHVNYVGSSANTNYEAGSGSDFFDGGTGVDTVDLASAGTGQVVSLDGSANDGTCPATGFSRCTGTPQAGSVDDWANVDEVTGGPGNDYLLGTSGAQTFNGAGGFDFLDGGTGADVMDIGTGGGAIVYDSRSDNLNITLDGVANDGAVGENDDFGTATTIIGGSGTDVINASASASGVQLDGGPGGDTITGSPQGDGLTGGEGADNISAGAGDDTLVPGPGADTYNGGPNTDQLNYQDNSAGVTMSLNGLADDGEPGSNEALGSDIENLAGGSGDDTIAGNANANVILAGDGADTVRAGAGADTIFDDTNLLAVPSSCDSINPGDGSDSVTFVRAPANCRDTIDYSDALTSVDVTLDEAFTTGNGESPGSDTISQDGTHGLDVKTGGLADTVTINDAFDHRISTGLQGDSVVGGSGSESIDAGLGTDQVDGNGGTDTLDYSSRTAPVFVTLGDAIANEGEAGENDLALDMEKILGGSGNDSLTGDDGSNFISPAGGNDTVNGAGGDDSLVESSGANTVAGGDGNDTFTADADPTGSDAFDGGAGNDTADYSARGAAVGLIEDGAANDGSAGEGDSVIAIETAIGGSGNDGFGSGSAADGPDQIIGGAGTDVMSYAARSAAVAVNLAAGTGGAAGEGDVLSSIENANGGAGPDTVIGTDAPNSLLGGPGDDTIDGLLGGDFIACDAGSDTITYASRTAAVTASLNSATPSGVAGEGDNLLECENLVGGSGADKLTGSALANILLGGAGKDSLKGGSGNDQLRGGTGNDKLDGANGADKLFGDAGNDTLTGGKQKDSISGGTGNDSIFARDKTRDSLDGGKGKDKAKADKKDKRRSIEKAAVK